MGIVNYELNVASVGRSVGARLVLSLGSEPRMNVVPGASELALPFSTLEDALVSLNTRLP